MPRPRVYDGALHGQDYSTLKVNDFPSTETDCFDSKVIYLIHLSLISQCQAQCLENGSLYEDDTFGPEYNEEWRRPQDICDDPCLFDEGSSRFDVVQVSLVLNFPPKNMFLML